MFTTFNVLNDVSEMRSLINSFFNERPYMRTADDYPYVNLYEKDDVIELKVTAPGLKADDINLQVLENRLYIEADKKSDYEDKSYIRKERSFGSFKKTIELPYRVDQNAIEAVMKDGILSIKLRRSEDSKPKKIAIN
jgi:HSP20 family protein